MDLACALVFAVVGSAAATPEGLALVGGRVLVEDGRVVPRTVHVRAGRIRAVDARPAEADERAIDVSGAVLAPGVIDSHVHLAFGDPALELAGGLAAVVDLGSPAGLLEGAALAPLGVVYAGPIVTAPGGYPTRGWGRDGFGLEVESAADVVRAVEAMHARGARVLKLAIEPQSGPTLSAATMASGARAAHARGMRVGAHALRASSVRSALAAGADFLAHTPLERLPEDLVRAFCSRPDAAVVSTLGAFGARAAAIDNLRRMRKGGCIVLYGTDLGNGVGEGIQAGELAALAKAGLSAREILEAATRAPAAYFGLRELGAIAPGRAASLLALDADPTMDAGALGRRRLVVAGGAVVVSR